MRKVRTVLVDGWDRFSAADPGLLRLSSASTTVGSILVVLLVLALFDTPETLLVAGALSAMSASFAISDPRPRDQAVTLAWGLAVAAAVVTAGAELVTVRAAADVAFVLVIFFAVYARRYGPRGTGLGVIGFQLYFVSQFTHADPATLPRLYAVLVLAFASAAVARFGLVRATPERVLGRLGRAFRSRLAALVEAVAEVAELAGQAPAQSQAAAEAAADALRKRSARLHECALMIQARLEVSVPDEQTATLIEHRVAEAEIAAERLGRLVLRAHPSWTAGTPLSTEPADLPATQLLTRELRRLHALVLRNLYGPQPPGFHAARDELLGYRDGNHLPAAAPPVQDAFRAVGELSRAILGLRLALGYESENLPEAASEPAAVSTSTSTDAPAPTVAPAPGSTSTSTSTSDLEEELETEAACLQLQDPAASPTPPQTGLHRLTTRLACQVTAGSALAILGGELLSPQRWYWAVLTCWVVFMNTSSTGDILVKGYRRLAGTVIGVLAGAALAQVVGGDSRIAFALVIVCVFGMFYTAPLSYTLMSFFVTTMIGVLYSLLGIFSAGVLVLRIEETAVGAACGFLAATLVLPIQISRRTDIQLADVLDKLRLTLTLAVARLAAGPDGPFRGFPAPADALLDQDVVHATRGLDAALDTLRASVEPITHPASPLRARRRRARYVLGVLEGCAYHVRNLAAAAELSHGDPRFGPEPRLTPVGLRLDRNARVLAEFVRSEGKQAGRLASDPDVLIVFSSPAGPGPGRESEAESEAGAQTTDRVVAVPEGLIAWRVVSHLQRIDEALLGLARPLGLPHESSAEAATDPDTDTSPDSDPDNGAGPAAAPGAETAARDRAAANAR
ncbi:MAG TPA: FUSC family protein [Actinocrinis sp.]|nr:FUSC family protein [Actinocrinis sp.]